MEKTRPILYGVADYAELRKANAWFVDRTAKIRDLEATRYAVFLRPRRFGKSLLTAILETYYDVACAERFDSLFSGTDIGGDPTDGGFYDIAFEPQLLRWPEIAHAALIEMKYVKAGDPAPTPEQLTKIKSETIDQLDQYSADPALIAEWHIGGRGATALLRAVTSAAPPAGATGIVPDIGVAGVSSATGTTGVSPVVLHRLVLVFHGGECVLSEEV